MLRDDFTHISGSTYGGCTTSSVDCGVNDLCFNDLEMYLAGFRFIDELQWPITFVEGAVFQGFGPPNCPVGGQSLLVTSTPGFRNVVADEVIATYGLRQPDPGSSQRDFKAAMIVVYDRLLTPTELAFFDAAAREHEMQASPILLDGTGLTLFEASGNEAALSTRLAFHPGDANGDGAIDIDDLLLVISAWGPCPSPPKSCPADLAPKGGDGTVDVSDLLVVINNWS
jgi:hypothetical protein